MMLSSLTGDVYADIGKIQADIEQLLKGNPEYFERVGGNVS